MKSKHGGRKRKTVSPTSAKLKHASLHSHKPRPKSKSHRTGRTSDPLPRSSQPLVTVSPARPRKSLPDPAPAPAPAKRHSKSKDRDRSKSRKQRDSKTAASQEKSSKVHRRSKHHSDDDAVDEAPSQSESGSESASGSGSDNESASSSGSASGSGTETGSGSGSSSDSQDSRGSSDSGSDSDTSAGIPSPNRPARALGDGGASKVLRKVKKSPVMTQFDTDAAVTAQSYEDCLKSSRRLFVAFLGDDVAATVLKNLQEIEGRMSTGVEAYDRERESLMDALRKSQLKADQRLARLEDASRRVIANRLTTKKEIQASVADCQANLERLRLKFEATGDALRSEIKASARKSK